MVHANNVAKAWVVLNALWGVGILMGSLTYFIYGRNVLGQGLPWVPAVFLHSVYLALALLSVTVVLSYLGSLKKGYVPSIIIFMTWIIIVAADFLTQAFALSELWRRLAVLAIGGVVISMLAFLYREFFRRRSELEPLL